MSSQTEQQMITIYILSNISRSQLNLTMKFGELTKYSVKKIFPQKSRKK